MRSNDIPKTTDPDVERIATDLFEYITTTNAFPHTLKLMICEALYEMKAVAKGGNHG